MIYTGRDGLNVEKQAFADISNTGRHTGSFEQALAGADVLIGLSGGTVPPEAVRSMNPGSIVFAMANPVPEVLPRSPTRAAPPSSPPVAATSRTRSTTCSPSRASSRAR